jgi:hypothetical protein
MNDVSKPPLLIDREWESDDEEDPATEVLLDGGDVSEDGVPGLFRPNPAYRPTPEWPPHDPVDAVLRTMAETGTGEEAFGEVLRSSLFTIAADEEGVPLVRLAPDGQTCFLVAPVPGRPADEDALWSKCPSISWRSRCRNVVSMSCSTQPRRPRCDCTLMR